MKRPRKSSSPRLRLRSNAPRPRRSPGAQRHGSGVAKESERRKDIIDRAAPILMREGYKGISMNELARRLHLTKPGLYYHFKDKQELLYASMHRSMDFIEKMSLQATMGAHDNEQRLREIIYQHALRVAVSERKGALTTVRATLVARFVAMTVAPRTTAPDSSLIVPCRSAPVRRAWARAPEGSTKGMSRSSSAAIRDLIEPPDTTLRRTTPPGSAVILGTVSPGA